MSEGARACARTGGGIAAIWNAAFQLGDPTKVTIDLLTERRKSLRREKESVTREIRNQDLRGSDLHPFDVGAPSINVTSPPCHHTSRGTARMTRSPLVGVRSIGARWNRKERKRQRLLERGRGMSTEDFMTTGGGEHLRPHIAS